MVSSSFLLSFFFFSSPNLSRRRIGCLPYFHTWCDLSANLRCRSETCCTRLAKIQDAKKSPKIAIRHHRTTLSAYVFACKAHIDNRKKSVKEQYILQMFQQYMVNFGPLAAEIDSVVWGTPANFNGFRVLCSLLRKPTKLCTMFGRLLG